MTEIRAHNDNVIVRLLPREQMTASGIHIPETATTRQTGTVRAVVIASGPGFRSRNGRGAFIPNEVKAGDVVLIDALAGQDYSLDVNVPRHNKDASWADERGEFRIVRHDEIHCVVEEGAAAE